MGLPAHCELGHRPPDREMPFRVRMQCCPRTSGGNMRFNHLNRREFITLLGALPPKHAYRRRGKPVGCADLSYERTRGAASDREH